MNKRWKSISVNINRYQVIDSYCKLMVTLWLVLLWPLIDWLLICKFYLFSLIEVSHMRLKRWCRHLVFMQILPSNWNINEHNCLISVNYHDLPFLFYGEHFSSFPSISAVLAFLVGCPNYLTTFDHFKYFIVIWFPSASPALMQICSWLENSLNFLILVQFTNGDVNTESNDHLKFTLYKSANTEDVRKKFRRTLVSIIGW
jgi:hypothetical protein